MATNPLHDVLIEHIGTRPTEGNPRGRALTTQESHRHTGAFKPYIYKGTGQDVLTGPKLRARKGENTAPATS